MQLIITDGWLARRRPRYLRGSSLFAVLGLCAGLAGLAVAALVYWAALLPWAQPSATSERVLKENLVLMATQVGALQAKLTQIEALSERVSSLAGIGPLAASASGQGGPLMTPQSQAPEALAQALTSLGERTGAQEDLLTVLEQRLLDDRVRALMQPTQWPVPEHAAGSPFGWRPDPFTHQSALHTGLDFPADEGTPVVAAAGGVVVAQEFHPTYGNLLELDHGNEVVTRYAHLSKARVRKGDLVKRGQHVADVGNTGRSTGPHLHFEVLVRGRHQNPAPFLAAGRQPVLALDAATLAAKAKARDR